MIPPIVSNHPVTRLACMAAFTSHWSIPAPTSGYRFGGFYSRILQIPRMPAMPTLKSGRCRRSAQS
jgi:hypothetical protein